MRDLAYPPHVTLAVYEEDAVEESDIFAALRRAVADGSVVRLTFDSIRTFEGDSTVFWAAPRPDETLIRLHRTVHDAIDPARCHPHYRPGDWIPHSTLATAIRPEGEAAARRLAAAFEGAITVDFDALEGLSFRPVRIIKTCRLGSSG